ncbi:transmembrane ascorbate-dependent reductase CYB561 [Corythoichthys intestinalis]|uniref:transmembrane ascorbate-dependent reductase CYB561 n=1 Tax=Corythoichthys intestinalis TaxID=161448 RepID=UPI0025A5E713|nr:transmembrane ascorbate-dependent reductase CYB561 [Corythoichthys intestinalis]XP_057716885.1 transmembrane ascorbate-dependent reductase CYB561 [Corythoichthys intestinalis]XP_061805511.1 transmembrane ascorbate-dependent reductase CYB561-like [Nerophis lumbriciformis]
MQVSSAQYSDRAVFAWLVAGSQVLGVTAVVLTGVWMGHYHGGFAWDGTQQEFNLHPLCMVLGLVFLQGDAILVYRVFHNEPKKNVKMLHGMIHLLALIISIVGMVAVFDSHRAANYADMYSLHSWCGLITIVLFCLQWVMGLLFFLFPVASSWLRATYLPIHVFCGLVLLALSVGSSLLGITEKLFFSIMSSYSRFPPEGVLANVLGVLLVCFGVLLCYMITNEQYRRPRNPEEESLAVHFKTLTEGGSPTEP